MATLTSDWGRAKRAMAWHFSGTERRSLTYKVNKAGPRMDPWPHLLSVGGGRIGHCQSLALAYVMISNS